MTREKLRRMIIQECACMANDVELPGEASSALPMLKVLGYDHDEDTDEIEISGEHDGDEGFEFEDSGDGEESSMVKNNLSNMMNQTKKLHDYLGDEDDLPEWVQEKVAVANNMMDTVYDYLNAESEKDVNEARGRKPWYMKKRRNMKKTEENAWYDIPKKSAVKKK